MRKSKLKKTSELHTELNHEGVVKLLLKDHEAMRVLMAKIRSHRKQSAAKIYRNFALLENLVTSHVAAEEYSLLTRIAHHPKFTDHALESYEEHRVHEAVLKGIHKLRDAERKITQIKIFCELLEDHIDEEEEDLFPQFKKYAALTTRQKMGTLFLKRRKATHAKRERLGALGDTL